MEVLTIKFQRKREEGRRLNWVSCPKQHLYLRWREKTDYAVTPPGKLLFTSAMISSNLSDRNTTILHMNVVDSLQKIFLQQMQNSCTIVSAGKKLQAILYNETIKKAWHNASQQSVLSRSLLLTSTTSAFLLNRMILHFHWQTLCLHNWVFWWNKFF